MDTGETTMTGGRIKKIGCYLDKEDFCLTYGDGVGDINITELIDFHNQNKVLATVTATRPPGRFGSLKLSEDLQNKVHGFQEKPMGDGGWINGGFFVLSPQVLDYIDNEQTVWEYPFLNEVLPVYEKFGSILSAFNSTVLKYSNSSIVGKPSDEMRCVIQFSTSNGTSSNINGNDATPFYGEATMISSNINSTSIATQQLTNVLNTVYLLYFNTGTSPGNGLISVRLNDNTSSRLWSGSPQIPNGCFINPTLLYFLLRKQNKEDYLSPHQIPPLCQTSILGQRKKKKHFGCRDPSQPVFEQYLLSIRFFLILRQF